MIKAIFEGLVYDLLGRQLPVVYVGNEPTYVIDDNGFERHVPASYIDRQVWDLLSAGVEGNEEFLSEQTAKMLGQEDIFSMAVIRSQFENRDKQFYDLQEKGFPYDARMYLTMIGFKIVVDNRGDLQEVKQPAVTNGDEE
ncbi:MAG: hypothetical protein AAGU15_01750 [Anaerolineaceae bacterium]